MSFARARMTHRALVERNTPTGPDAYNQPGPPDWDEHIEAMPCWLYTPGGMGGGQEDVEVPRTEVWRHFRALIPLSADITELDRINGVTDRLGAVIYAGILNVRVVLPKRRTHREIILQAVV